ncbi:S-adenosyl-L-methionine-dependent methyltransferase [Macroventuria anomochaeta]|uniref:S-adenosyl-L-methionine-dependent methyltransferase n=1 Tax=Macroventuria anomochaeta TaxID=301207 RepID=A0ACB6RZJ4_9PLEO|nr:S-adenosyl-L-methionine-dependent methyltransferase [Macroventuria anomochaeta]KAF2627198.1 S-adenosyl-L-methionine-dependent methyltransferase [Macroventuria anomochaeta]
MGDSSTPKPTEGYFDNKARAAAYEASTGGCTRDLARHILTLCPSITSGSVIHDNACGTGIVAQEIVARNVLTKGGPDADYALTIHCTDKSEAMVSLTQSGYQGCESANSMLASFLNVRVHFTVTPSESLSFPDGTFSHSFTNCGILHFDNGLTGAREILRTLKPGGTAVVTSWKELKPFEVVREAQRACGHEEPLFRPPVDEKWFKAETLESVLRDAGFETVEIGEKTVHVAGKDVGELCGHLMALLSRYSQKWSGEEETTFRKQLEIEVEKAVVPIKRPSAEEGVEELVGIPMVALVGVARK